MPAGDYYPLQDLLYRTTALTDHQGDIVEVYDYDAYGNTLIFSAAGAGGNWWGDDATQASYGACDVLYCGYLYDSECKTYQVRRREYYPTLGRWLQRDPIGFDGGDWNLYGYITSNVIKRIDPSGLQYDDFDIVSFTNDKFQQQGNAEFQGIVKGLEWLFGDIPCCMTKCMTGIDVCSLVHNFTNSLYALPYRDLSQLLSENVIQKGLEKGVESFFQDFRHMAYRKYLQATIDITVSPEVRKFLYDSWQAAIASQRIAAQAAAKISIAITLVELCYCAYTCGSE